MEFTILKLTRLLGPPTVTENPIAAQDDTLLTEQLTNLYIQSKDSTTQTHGDGDDHNVENNVEGEDAEVEEIYTFSFTCNDEENDDENENKGIILKFEPLFIDISLPSESIQLRHNEQVFPLENGVNDLNHLMQQMSQWSHTLHYLHQVSSLCNDGVDSGGSGAHFSFIHRLRHWLSLAPSLNVKNSDNNYEIGENAKNEVVIVNHARIVSEEWKRILFEKEISTSPNLPFGCMCIEMDTVLIFNNPLAWSSLGEYSQSIDEFCCCIRATNDNDDGRSVRVFNRLDKEQLVHLLSEERLLGFEWTHELNQLSNNELSNCSIWKLDLSDEEVLKVLTSSNNNNNSNFRQMIEAETDVNAASDTTAAAATSDAVDPTEQLLLFDMTDSRERWAKVVRDESFQVWKCFIGIPAHNQSILFEQSHTMIQYLDSIQDLTMGKLTFSGKMKRGQLKKSYFPNEQQYREFCAIKADEMWWFGFDFNHTPIAHFQVFEAMKQKGMDNVPTLGQYLLENPDDFTDVSPLEYSTPNWIKTSIEIDGAVPRRSYKDIATCRRVIHQVNDALFQNEEIFLQLMRYEMIEEGEGEEQDGEEQ